MLQSSSQFQRVPQRPIFNWHSLRTIYIDFGIKNSVFIVLKGQLHESANSWTNYSQNLNITFHLFQALDLLTTHGYRPKKMLQSSSQFQRVRQRPIFNWHSLRTIKTLVSRTVPLIVLKGQLHESANSWTNYSQNLKIIIHLFSDPRPPDHTWLQTKAVTVQFTVPESTTKANIYLTLSQNHMSSDMRFPTMWYVRLAKAQTSLRIRASWSELLLVAWILYEC